MKRFKYLGEDDRYFPTIGIEILAENPDKTFQAPDDFEAHNVIATDEVEIIPPSILEGVEATPTTAEQGV